MPALLASQFAWGGSCRLSVPVAPFTWAVRELRTERYVSDPTALLRWIALRLATQQAYHYVLFMALITIDSHFGNNIQCRLHCSSLSCTSCPSLWPWSLGRWLELCSVRYGQLDFNDPAAGGERVWD